MFLSLQSIPKSCQILGNFIFPIPSQLTEYSINEQGITPHYTWCTCHSVIPVDCVVLVAENTYSEIHS